MKLVVVESPAKCSKIQGFLGQGWKVIATFGHIRALQEDLDAIGLDRNFEPNYTFLKEKAKSISNLKEAAKDATTVYLASDDDREGEAIGYDVIEAIGKESLEIYRAKFSALTKQDIEDAIDNLVKPQKSLSDAVKVRQEVDLRIGASFTRF